MRHETLHDTHRGARAGGRGLQRECLPGGDPGARDGNAVGDSRPLATPAPTATPVAISATVTFDGQTCTYAGPAVVPRGAAVTFTLVNTPAWAKGSLGAALLVAPVRDGTTWEQVLAYAEKRHVFPLPEWILIPGTGVGPYGADAEGLGEALSLIPDEARVDKTGTIVMTRDQYVVVCNTHPDEGQRPYPAVLLKVEATPATPAPTATPLAISATVTFDGRHLHLRRPARHSARRGRHLHPGQHAGVGEGIAWGGPPRHARAGRHVVGRRSSPTPRRSTSSRSRSG